ncbi:hypothetical protein SAMN04515668_1712 [Hymenobacter arizonensis]|uniref:Uncharacterized protein n=1 Tax=Hymenobacter arizonensis TaxID=1227077 RepID=A0A1I5X8U0_HYMAR|nr:hypothetical protein SAMN04515668_1712 [Hymenobacter arizonensis]
MLSGAEPKVAVGKPLYPKPVMLSLRSIFSRLNDSFSCDKMLRKLSMTDV